MLRKLQNLPIRQKQTIIAVVLVLVLFAAIGTYGIWRTKVSIEPTNSLFPELAGTLSETKDGILQTTGNLTNEFAQQQKRLQEQERSFTEDLTENEFFINREVSTNNVAVNLRKMLIDPDKTVVWLKLTNNSENEVRFDPLSGIEAEAGKSLYLPTPLSNPQLQADYELEGYTELREAVVLAPQETLQGYVKLQTIPHQDALSGITLLFTDFLNPTSSEKWDYTMVLTEKDLTK